MISLECSSRYMHRDLAFQCNESERIGLQLAHVEQNTIHHKNLYASVPF